MALASVGPVSTMTASWWMELNSCLVTPMRAALRVGTGAARRSTRGERLAAGNFGAGLVGWWGSGPGGVVAGQVGGLSDWRAGAGGLVGGLAGRVGGWWAGGGAMGGGGPSGVLAGRVGAGVVGTFTRPKGVCMAE